MTEFIPTLLYASCAFLYNRKKNKTLLRLKIVLFYVETLSRCCPNSSWSFIRIRKGFPVKFLSPFPTPTPPCPLKLGKEKATCRETLIHSKNKESRPDQQNLRSGEAELLPQCCASHRGTPPSPRPRRASSHVWGVLGAGRASRCFRGQLSSWGSPSVSS